MDAGGLIGLVLSLGLTLVITLVTLLATALSFLIPIGFMAVFTWIFIKRLQSGDAQIVVSSPLLAAAIPQTGGGPKRIKEVRCKQCGGSRSTPYKTAYVYCDFCGSLTDWDFQKACATAGSARPGPAYEALQRKEQAVQDEARRAGDVLSFEASIRRVFDAYIDAAPGGLSPRIKEPEYREAQLTYMTRCYTAAGLDEDCRRRELAMQGAVKGLQWRPGFGTTKVEPSSFRTLLDTFLDHNARFLEVSEPFLDDNPDGADNALLRRIGASAFAQGWLPYLDKAEQDAMIQRLDLDGSYIDVPDVATTTRHCGGCARELRVVDGAKRVLCEDCGHLNDVEHPEIPCTGCGSPFSVQWSKKRFACPSCSTELRVD